MYKENGVEINRTMAALMCSAIISDTLLFRSPTCTPADRRTCEELADIAGINMEELARSMFNAGSDLSGKTAEEICAMDFKPFVCGDMTFGVGQISSMDREELDEIKGKLEPAMNELMKEKELNMLFFMPVSYTHLDVYKRQGYTVAFLVYQIGTLITEGHLGTGFVPGLIAVAVMAAIVAMITVRSSRKLAAEYALHTTNTNKKSGVAA